MHHENSWHTHLWGVQVTPASTDPIQLGSPRDDRPTDGRTRRRQRNIETVLDATAELFATMGEPPTPEQVAEHCGISLSSIYRYFDKPSQMYLQAAERRVANIAQLAAIDDLGNGPLPDRIDRYLANRWALYKNVAPVGRVWSRLGHRDPDLLQRRAMVITALSEQTEAHFATELDAMSPQRRRMVVATIDSMMQIATFDHLIDQRGMTPEQGIAVCRDLLAELLDNS